MSSHDGYESGKQTLGCEKIRASIHFCSLLPLPPGFRSKQKRTASSRRIMCWSIRPQRWRCTSQDDELFCRTHRRTNVDTDGGTWRLFLFFSIKMTRNSICISFFKSGELIHKPTGKCLDRGDNTEMSDVSARECNNGPTQIWKFDHYSNWTTSAL